MLRPHGGMSSSSRLLGDTFVADMNGVAFPLPVMHRAASQHKHGISCFSVKAVFGV
jgi:hypothetical protein